MLRFCLAVLTIMPNYLINKTRIMLVLKMVAVISVVACCLTGCGFQKNINKEKVELNSEIIVEIDGDDYFVLPFDADDCVAVEMLSYGSAPPFHYFKMTIDKRKDIEKVYNTFSNVKVQQSTIDGLLVIYGGWNIRLNFILKDYTKYTIQSRPNELLVYGLIDSENTDDLDALYEYDKTSLLVQIETSNLWDDLDAYEVLSTYPKN